MSSEAIHNWRLAFPLADLPAGKARAVKLDRQQIAIFRREHDGASRRHRAATAAGAIRGADFYS
jgi:hypothetical protein